MSALEIPFGNPTESNGFCPFAMLPEHDTQLLFHGTSERCATVIIADGFSPKGSLASSSFTRSAGLALRYACNKRQEKSRGSVLIVTFKDLNVPGIKNDGDIVYLYNHEYQPEVIGVCYVPESYEHR